MAGIESGCHDERRIETKPGQHADLLLLADTSLYFAGDAPFACGYDVHRSLLIALLVTPTAFGGAIGLLFGKLRLGAA